MKILYIFIMGLMILFGAILLNLFASRVGLLSWFDFLKNPSKANMLSYIWLFILYPFGLGIIAYFSSKLVPL
ncbi:hypothetical protein HN858_02695 [Candidatus Falkowbacteria bacterium]|jgi:hypothetical protein|nr:hypothetical protein [Candidatus Falkowbacteria bacterium]MBT7348564.1 hypothetical protein [Candidatus Falkowbacteria bacterium]MBT7501052.1 hypothetical protein [Candidatus Falkowbacteria bacterium]